MPSAKRPAAVPNLAEASGQEFPPAILILGPTASGKSALAMEIARVLPVEVISVDSGQIYRGMDIGTAKPGPAERAAVPHHLLDILEPHESYSAGRFRDDAQALMREISERGRIPLLAGGTMLYFKALLEGLNELPQADPALRLVLDAMAAESGGWPEMHRRLAQVDPETAARLAPGDAQRIQRAMEVFHLTGRPMSELLKKPKYVYLPYRMIRIALLPASREELHARIARRFEDMLELGLIGEVRRLREQYGLESDTPSMRCVGYRQTWAYLEGKYDLGALREKGVAATRQLAKRQLTWLRAMDGLMAFDCLDPALAQRVMEFLGTELGAGAARAAR
ncbi:MAG TPA: tRNA (adenosine(37)-N6)-dimethylallyltransferase MiaA [Burkholderiales bacterium]|nr:tRNA (adenosine(37)-N6)-dimethylallyltransferase MiaA [Burkholderiales bacterium]